MRNTLRRAAAVLVPLALLLGTAGTAQAAKTTTPPPAVLAMPEKYTKATGAAFAWTVEASTTYTCSLDGAAFAACSSPATYTGLVDGAHTWTVRAKLTGASPADTAYDWTVDTVAPPAPVVVPVASPTNRTSVGVAFTDEDPSVSFTCSLDGAAPAACASPHTVTAATEGPHSLKVVAVDLARNASPAATTSWVVDVTAPGAPVLVQGPAERTVDRDATVVFAGSDATATSFACSLDGAPAEPCSTTWTATGLAVGPHALVVTAYDAAGNASPAATVASWTVDRTAWAPVITSGPDPVSSVTDPVFAFQAGDVEATTGFRCSLDGGPETPCTSPVSTSSLGGPLADGEHVLTVVAEDALGSVSEPASYLWSVDTQPPVVAPEPAPGVPLETGPTTGTPSFVFASEDPAVAGFACSVDGAAFVTCTSPYEPVVPDGAHSLDVVAVDAAGNLGTTPLHYTWTLDTTAPLAQVGAPATLTGPVVVSLGEEVVGLTAALQVEGGASVATTLVCRDAAAAVTACTGPVRSAVVTPLARLLPGQRYAVTVTAKDAAGNAAVVTGGAFRAQLQVQESDPAVGQAWASLSSTAALGGRYAAAQLAGATASWAFRGTSVTWYTATGPGMGTAKVYCGSTLKATVSNWASRPAWRVPRTVTCSSTVGSHVLKVVVTGLKGSTAGTGTRVVVDAVKVGSTTYANPSLVTRWRPVGAASASGGRYAAADLPGDALSFAFRGTSVRLATVAGPVMGYARVYLDGVLVGTLDGFATTYRYGVARTWSVADGVHTLRVVATGTHRTGSKGNLVAVDSLTVA